MRPLRLAAGIAALLCAWGAQGSLAAGDLRLALGVGGAALALLLFAAWRSPTPALRLVTSPRPSVEKLEGDSGLVWAARLRRKFRPLRWKVPTVKPPPASIRLGLGLLGLAAAVAGQFCLEQQKTLAASMLFGPALFASFVTLRSLPASIGRWLSWGRAESGAGGAPSKRRGQGAVVAALVLSLAAFVFFDSPMPSIVAWLLHLASIVLLVLACVRLDRIPSIEGGDAGMPRWTRLEVAALAGILLAGLFMRVFRLDQFPPGLYYDEAVNGWDALQILRGAGELPIYLSASSSLSAHLSYLIAAAFSLLGPGILGLRLVSVLFGLGTVLAAYLAGSELFDRRMGLLLAFFLAVSRWDFNWSRIGMHGVTVPFFELAALGFLLRGLRRNRLLDFALAGLLLGLGICFYLPLRLFPVVVLVFLAILWMRQRNLVRVYRGGFLMIALGLWLVAVPIVRYTINHPQESFARFNTVSIFTNRSFPEALQAVQKTAVEHLLMFNYHGDNNGRHNLPGAPMLDIVSGGLFVLGLALTLRRIREPSAQFLLLWFFLMLLPGILSLDFESPQSLRAIGTLPVAYIFALVPVQALWSVWDETIQGPLRRGFAAGVVGLCLVCGTLNYHTYFDLQANDLGSWAAFSTAETYIARRMADVGSRADFYVSSLYAHTPTLAFLAFNIKDYHVLETHSALPLALDGSKETILFVDGERVPFEEQARRYYPQAEYRQFKAPNGQTIVYEIDLKPQDIRSVQGLEARYFRATEPGQDADWTQEEANFNFDWSASSEPAGAQMVEWRGVLFASVYGTYTLQFQAPAPLKLWVDERALPLSVGAAQAASLELARGNHSLRFSTLKRPGHFEFDWQPPNGILQPVPGFALLLPRIDANGLLGKYFSNPDWKGRPAFTQIDPWIHFYFHNPPLPRPYSVEWTGQVQAAKDGLYRFGLESIDESALWIDGRLVVSATTPNQYQEGQVNLSAGSHAIRITFADRTSSTHINVYWTPPGGERESLPQGVLTPGN